MALYADENFPLRVIEELRRLGQDVLTVFEDGRATQSIIDFDILARATERQGNRYSQSCRFQKVTHSDAWTCRNNYLHRGSGSYWSSATNC
jgi:hypothetical protein